MPELTASTREATKDYCAALLDRFPAGLRQALSPDNPVVRLAQGDVPPELMEGTKGLLLARMAADHARLA